jgi:hypothetical protein
VSLRRSTGRSPSRPEAPVYEVTAVGAAGHVGEQADQDGTDDATDQVDADHVERVVPSQMKVNGIWPPFFPRCDGNYSAG